MKAMFKKVWIRIFFIILLLSFGHKAGTASRGENYAKIAINNKRDLQIAEEQVKLAKLRVVNAVRILGPTITLQYKETEGSTIDDPFKSKAYSILATQTVFTGGKKYYTLKRELATLSVARSEKLKLEQIIKYEAVKAYYNALMSQEKLINTRKLIDDIKKEILIADKKYSAKIITQVEYLDVMDLRDELRLQEKILENDLALAVLELKTKCSIDFNVDINFEEEKLEKEENFMDLSLDGYKDFALKKRPEVNAQENLVMQMEYTEKISKAESRPGINLEGSIGKSGEAYIYDDLVLATEWSVYANLQWLFWGSSAGFKMGKRKTKPSEILDYSIKTKLEERIVQMSVLDRMDYFYERQEKKLNRKQATKDLEDIRKKVLMEVEKSYLALQATGDMIVLTENKVKLNDKKVDIVEKNNFLGEATSKDLIESRMKALQQRNSLVEAIVKYNLALVELKVSCGIDVCPIRNDNSEIE